MSTAQFLDAVLPVQGLRFALATFGVQGDPDFRPAQRSFEAHEMDRLIGYCRWATGSGANCYFAVAGYATVLNENGKPQRLGTAASWHRCLRLDIDVGADKAAAKQGYATKRDALVALLLGEVGEPGGLDLAGLGELLGRLTTAHTERMRRLGLDG